MSVWRLFHVIVCISASAVGDVVQTDGIMNEVRDTVNVSVWLFLTNRLPVPAHRDPASLSQPATSRHLNISEAEKLFKLDVALLKLTYDHLQTFQAIALVTL